jgi:hypothetical protein
VRSLFLVRKEDLFKDCTGAAREAGEITMAQFRRFFHPVIGGNQAAATAASLRESALPPPVSFNPPAPMFGDTLH